MRMDTQKMTFHTQAFDNLHFRRMDIIGHLLMRPEVIMINFLLSWFKLTTREHADRYEDPCYERYVYITFITPVLSICIILYLPVFFLGFLLWAPVQSRRNPYVLHINEALLQAAEVPINGFQVIKMVTSDTCLYPEFWSRLWNLSNTKERAVKIGDKILGKVNLIDGYEPKKQKGSNTQAKMGYGSCVTGTNEGQNEDTPPTLAKDIPAPINNDTPPESVVNHLVEQIPCDADVVFLQGVFDVTASQHLVSCLSSGFPFVVGDVTKNAWQSNRFSWSSGLMLASRIPPVSLDFVVYSDHCKKDRYKAAGFLVVEFEMNQGATGDGPTRVCMINTQLEEGHGITCVEIRNKQMSQIEEYLQRKARSSQEDHLMILCGNLNFHAFKGEVSNMSHSFYQMFKDPCESPGGNDEGWVVGTDLLSENMHNKSVATPENLLSCLATEEGREDHLLGDIGGIQEGRSETDFRWRRSSKILYKKSQTYGRNVRCGDFQFITDFSTMTKHLPIATSFFFETKKE